MNETSVIQRSSYTNEQLSLNSFFAQVFGWMTFGLAITTIIAFGILAMVSVSETFGDLVVGILPLVFILELVVVVVLSAFWSKFNLFVTAGLFLFYASLNGLFFGVVFYSYTIESVITALVSTTLVFAVMATFGALTKQDLTKIGTIAYVGLFGLIIATVVNIVISLFNSSFATPLSWILTYVGLLIFLILTAYDMQKLKKFAISSQKSGVELSKVSINGALMLYLDYINLFIRILRIMGKRR